MHTIAPDDIVQTLAEAAGNARPPLLVLDPLERFLDERGLGSGAVTATPVGEGHSNVTFLVVREGWEGIVRRPPRPPLPPSAHDVVREARVLRAVGGTARVPAVLAVCEDDAVIGAPFYVMEKVDGHVVTSEVPAALDAREDRRRMGEEIIDAALRLPASEAITARLTSARALALLGSGRAGDQEVASQAVELARATARLRAEAEREQSQASRAAEQAVLTSREALLAQVLALGRERLLAREPGAGERQAVTALLGDALRYLDGGPVAVQASPTLLDLVRGALTERPVHAVTAEPSVPAGGIVRGEGGRVTVDASLGGRLAARELEARIVILKLLEAQG